MANTPRLGLRNPAGADSFAIASDISQIVTILDNAAIWQKGTMAARPSANAVKDGTVYWATDRGDLAWSDGTTWFTVTPAALSAFIATDAVGPWASPSGNIWTDINGYDTESYDPNSNFDPTTGVFTAPVKGLYYFEGEVAAFSGSFGYNDQHGVRLVTTGAIDAGNYPLAIVSGDDATQSYSERDLIRGSRIQRVAAGGTAKIQSYWQGGGSGLQNARFAGHLIQQLP